MFLVRTRRAILGISLDEVRMERRGFRPSSSAAAERLERIGRSFLGGYHTALEVPFCGAIAQSLDSAFLPEYRGFAYEGAAMALTLLDRLSLRRPLFPLFLKGAGAPHAYMLHVGAGWAFARLPWVRWNLPCALSGMDPLLRWLAMDGFGFHEGYFHWRQSIRNHAVPAGVHGYACRAFDQGLGRSLWFVEGIDPQRIADSIRSFPSCRHPDLWSGVGLACAYAGGATPAGLEQLRDLAGEHLAAVAQGAAFAAAARRRAGNPVVHCDAACRILCQTSAERAADIPVAAMAQLPHDGGVPAYEVWRQRVQQHFSVPERSLA